MASRGFQPKNKEMFSRGGTGPSIYNGYGTTKTPPAPTLFITNIPAGASAVEVEQLFRTADGFQGVRTVRHMVFVDFYDTRSATEGMRRHQNHFLEGFEVEQGLMIDFDKDPRHKRNKAFTAQRDRGAFTRGFSDGYQPMAAEPVKRPPRDATLDLINEIKRKHREEEGVVVPLNSDSSALQKRQRQGGGGEGLDEGPSFALPAPKLSILSEESLSVPGKLIRKPRKKSGQTAALSTGESSSSSSSAATAARPPEPKNALAGLLDYGSSEEEEEEEEQQQQQQQQQQQHEVKR
jgi:hypothetical protein